MATKRKSQPRKAAGSKATAAQVRMLDALHQVWLAGLGAASKAQRGAPQVFADLVKEGARVHSKNVSTAQKAVRGLMDDMQTTIDARVGQVRGKAADVLENLEKIFQTRVHRALTQLGVPTAEEIAKLSKQVDALNASIDKLTRSRGAARPRPQARAAPAAPPAS
jgi:poly(hydroxyalkanoate) granule-associated protein